MQIYAKVKETRLVGTLLPSDTSFVVSNADDLPTLDVGEYFVVYLKQGLKSETCYCTSVVGTTFTVSRAEENTNPLRFNNGALIEINVTPESYTFVTSGGAVDSVNGQTGTVVLDADDIDDTSTTNKFVTASDLTKLSNTSGTNSGDQTSIVGISGTKAQFDTACSDGNFLYTGDVTQYIDEMAQDAVGGMVDSSLVYVDGTPLLQRAALTGDVTASAGSNSTTISNDAVTYAKMQNVSATDKILGRSTAGSGDVEEIACTAAGRALIDDADATAQRATLGLVIGTNVQAYDAELAAIAGLTSAADKLPYFSGSGTAALADLSSAMRTFMTTPSSANLRSLLSDEVGTGAAYFVGGALSTPASGNLVNCTTDACYAGTTGNQSCNNTTLTTINLNYEQFDTNGLHDTVTNNSRITIQVAGKYYVQAFGHWASNNTGLRQVYIKKNGTTFPFTNIVDAALVTGEDTHSISGVMNLNATDYIELVVWQNSGGALNLLGDSLSSIASGLLVVRLS